MIVRYNFIINRNKTKGFKNIEISKDKQNLRIIKRGWDLIGWEMSVLKFLRCYDKHFKRFNPTPPSLG